MVILKEYVPYLVSLLVMLVCVVTLSTIPMETERERFVSIALSVSVSLLMGMVTLACIHFTELLQLRWLTDFVLKYGGKNLQNWADAALTSRAKSVRSAKEDQLIFFTGGMDAVRKRLPHIHLDPPPGEKFEEKKMSDDLRSMFERDFQARSSDFYQLYRDISLFPKKMGVKLKGRDWELYAGKADLNWTIRDQEGAAKVATQ